jgi:hypothetical protein
MGNSLSAIDLSLQQPWRGQALLRRADDDHQDLAGGSGPRACIDDRDRTGCPGWDSPSVWEFLAEVQPQPGEPGPAQAPRASRDQDIDVVATTRPARLSQGAAPGEQGERPRLQQPSHSQLAGAEIPIAVAEDAESVLLPPVSGGAQQGPTAQPDVCGLPVGDKASLLQQQRASLRGQPGSHRQRVSRGNPRSPSLRPQPLGVGRCSARALCHRSSSWSAGSMTQRRGWPRREHVRRRPARSGRRRRGCVRRRTRRRRARCCPGPPS